MTSIMCIEITCAITNERLFLNMTNIDTIKSLKTKINIHTKVPIMKNSAVDDEKTRLNCTVFFLLRASDIYFITP